MDAGEFVRANALNAASLALDDVLADGHTTDADLESAFAAYEAAAAVYYGKEWAAEHIAPPTELSLRLLRSHMGLP